MKILFIHSHYYYRGGEDTIVAQEIELLKKHYEVDVLYFQNKIGFFGAIQFFLSIWNLYSLKAVKQKIKSFQPDVVHVHNWHLALGPLVFRYINKLRIPIVHTVHNYRLLCPSAILYHNQKLFTSSLRQSFPWKAVINKVYRSSVLQTFWLATVIWIHKKIGTWQKINAFICLTTFGVNVFQESNFGISKDKFVIKPNFIKIPKGQIQIIRENHFLFIGRLSEEKGIELLLKTFQKSDFQLKIAGDGPLKSLVLKESKNSPNIIYLGSLSKEKVFEELHKCQALIFPSLWYEGMPMTIIEAFSASTPVIASNIGAMSAMILDNENGCFFEAGNANDLLNKITKFNNLSTVEKEERNKNALLSYINNYSDELQIDYFNEIYKKLSISIDV